MSEDSDLEQLSAPTTALPLGFNIPPGMPTPTAEDFAASNKPNGAVIAQTPPSVTPWWQYALAVGGVALVGTIAYAIYRAKIASSVSTPSYQQLQETAA